MTVKIKHNKAHVLYKALGYNHCDKELQNKQTPWVTASTGAGPLYGNPNPIF